ncbi:hypothetical protein PV08_04113 [Exophiala spinifera]|uniref:RRM domain-containing protein n=1 Tax=Exophiala spinifera TaxID=91928 RepID=A0A0D2BD95_9EURO|nr:uncharacterized protein PV08_04113 [Exophiala spinifera]KIW16923.1 hypothetical protein PV08_04113 [Exophiala spinifera]
MTRTPFRGSAPASSPHSEHDTTFHGTPSTNLTSFTPATGNIGYRKPYVEEAAQRHANNWEEVREPAKTDAIRRTTPTKTASDDVFLTAPAMSSGPQLSPTARVFQPMYTFSAMPTVARRSPPLARVNRPHVFGPPPSARHGHGAHQTLTPLGTIAGVRTLLQDSVPDTKVRGEKEASAWEDRRPVSQIKCINGRFDTDIEAYLDRLGVWNVEHMNFMSNASGKYINDVHFSEGVFSTDEKAPRAFVVMGIPAEFRSLRVAEAFKIESFPSLKTINASQVVAGGLFTVAFSDVRDARKAWDVATKLVPHTRVFSLFPRGVAADQGYNPSHISDFEGQIILSVYYNGNPNFKQLEAAPIVAEIKRLLAQCGEVKAMHTLPSTQLHCRDFRVEFYDSAAVPVAKDVISGTILEGGVVLHAEAYSPDIVFQSDDVDAPFEQLSITGRSTVPVDEDYDRLAYAITRDVLRNGRRLNNTNHNAVDIARIQSGMDVRTTIMLRNIPNRVDQGMLKEIIDHTSFGRYDFMYLRIDFANNCNVGYAFINFVDFVLARAGKRWNCFSSDKVAEVSYATIQGKDCLVQKFRNSSVMLEHPAFRPKLYIAGNVPDAGQEEKFPSPDNHSKMRRSVENAEHVGLYLPRSMGPRNINPRAVHPRRRRVRHARRFNAHGVYLPPARAGNVIIYTPPPSPKSQPRRVKFVDTKSPSDPFSGTRPFP